MNISRGYEKEIELKLKQIIYRSIQKETIILIYYYNLLIMCSQSGNSNILDFCIFRESFIKQVKIFYSAF